MKSDEKKYRDMRDYETTIQGDEIKPFRSTKWRLCEGDEIGMDILPSDWNSYRRPILK